MVNYQLFVSRAQQSVTLLEKNHWNYNESPGADPGGSLGSGDPPPQHIREAKGMMCYYKNT